MNGEPRKRERIILAPEPAAGPRDRPIVEPAASGTLPQGFPAGLPPANTTFFFA